MYGEGFLKKIGLITWETFAYIHLELLNETDMSDFDAYEIFKSITWELKTNDILF